MRNSNLSFTVISRRSMLDIVNDGSPFLELFVAESLTFVIETIEDEAIITMIFEYQFISDLKMSS